jgi:hypothetical protein
LTQLPLATRIDEIVPQLLALELPIDTAAVAALFDTA